MPFDDIPTRASHMMHLILCCIIVTRLKTTSMEAFASPPLPNKNKKRGSVMGVNTLGWWCAASLPCHEYSLRSSESDATTAAGKCAMELGRAPRRSARCASFPTGRGGGGPEARLPALLFWGGKRATGVSLVGIPARRGGYSRGTAGCAASAPQRES